MSHATGFSVNQSKSEIMRIHHFAIPDICGIKVKETVGYLGTIINKCPLERVENHFCTCSHKAKMFF